MAKKQKTNPPEDILRSMGWWPCKECSNENWKVHHKLEELACPKTQKPRDEVEIKSGE